MMADEVLSVLRIEILLPQLPVGHFVTQDKVGGLQNTVGNHDGRLLFPFPARKPAKCGPEIGPFRVARGMGTCDEECPEPLIALAGPPTFALAGTLMVPGADLGPEAEVLRGGK